MRDALSRLIQHTNYFRPPVLGMLGTEWYKEWYHFCVVAPDLELILNLNVSADTRPAAAVHTYVSRVIVLVRENNAWDGDVDTILPRDVSILHGEIDVAFGNNTVRFANGEFYLEAMLQSRPITVSLRLTPQTLPLVMRANTPVSVGSINWVVVPRLSAEGIVIIDGRVYRLQHTPTYHDHNWGRWLWGHDFAWEWGFALTAQNDDQWSIVFDRTTNRARSRVLELTLALWKQDSIFRVFTQNEIAVRPENYLILRSVPKFPRIMTLVAPETTTDVPRVLHIHARSKEDFLNCYFESKDIAQIIIPNETDMGVTTINEVSGLLECSGRIKGERVEMKGQGIFEFLTS